MAVGELACALGRIAGRRLEAVGGMVLVVVGLEIVWSQVLG